MGPVAEAGPSKDPVLTSKGRPRRKRVRTVTGCLLCRQRRVKCDEQRPRCTNCQRHPNRVCEYEFEPVSHGTPTTTVDLQMMFSGSPLPPAQTFSYEQGAPPVAPTEPFLPPAYREAVVAQSYHALLDAQRAELDVLNPNPMGVSLADTLISLVPTNPRSPLRALLAQHSSLVRKSSANFEDMENRLLCSAMAMLSSKKLSENRRPGLLGHYMSLVKKKTSFTHLPITGKLGATGFTLFLSQILSPIPGIWREQLGAGVDWALATGGPGWVIGVSPPFPGYRGGELRNLEPFGMAVYSDFTALLSVLASLTDGSVPTYVTLDPSWLLASRAFQVKLSPSSPDLFEALLSAPRILMPTLARAVALSSRRAALAGQPDLLAEEVEHDATSLRTELELVWPARLATRSDPRVVQYGGRAWRIAILVLVMHQGQGFSPRSPEVIARVAEFVELASEAVADLSTVDGWLWAILIVACAASVEHREVLRYLASLSRSPVGERDNIHTDNILNTVWNAHDQGNPLYHIKDALRAEPSLDVLLL